MVTCFLKLETFQFQLRMGLFAQTMTTFNEKKHFLKTFPYIYIFLIFKPFITHLPRSKSEIIIKIFIPDAL